MASDRPVGVFDSGAGGISVLAALLRELPHEDFLYFGDTANAPYGTKPADRVLSLAESAFDRLLDRGAKAVVIACNTATAAAAAFLRAKHPDYPIIGMEPALKPASLLRHGGTILVLGTPVTLRLEKFQRLMVHYGEGAIPLPCPGLMELVEQMDFAEARRYLSRVLAPWRNDPPDAVVLGCTHYVFLRPVLSELLPPTTAVVDGNAGTARQLRRVLTDRGLLNDREEAGSRTLETSGDGNALALMARLLEIAP